jgi:CheY-like chemotaxis protein
MSTTTPIASAGPHVKSAVPASLSGGVERRRRKRARIAAQVHVSAVNAPEPFTEICKSVDVSRDGLLFVSARAGYWKSQPLDVMFPYSDAAAALNQAQRAEVVRVVPIEGGQYHVAVQFSAARSEAKSERKTGSSYAGPNARESAPAPASAAKGASPAPAASSAKQQSIVLAVEPDPKGADMLRALLSQDGYTVVTVPTAQQALDFLRTTIPSVFLAEVENEEMSGHDLCLIIKRNDRLQGVPVILLTRSAQPADYASSHQLGAVVCMAKPFKPERLRNVVRLVAPPPKIGGSAYGVSRIGNSSVERAL